MINIYSLPSDDESVMRLAECYMKTIDDAIVSLVELAIWIFLFRVIFSGSVCQAPNSLRSLKQRVT